MSTLLPPVSIMSLRSTLLIYPQVASLPDHTNGSDKINGHAAIKSETIHNNSHSNGTHDSHPKPNPGTNGKSQAEISNNTTTGVTNGSGTGAGYKNLHPSLQYPSFQSPCELSADGDMHAHAVGEL